MSAALVATPDDASHRQSSASSSSASYLTASQRISSSSFPSPSSSAHTLNPSQSRDHQNSPSPVHAPATPAFALPRKPSSQEVHIVQLIDETVCLETTSVVQDPPFRKVSPPFYRQQRTLSQSAGSSPENIHPAQQSSSEFPSVQQQQQQPVVSFDDPDSLSLSSTSPREHSGSFSSSSRQFPALASSSRTSLSSPPPPDSASSPSSHALLHRTSAETKASMTIGRSSSSTVVPPLSRFPRSPNPSSSDSPPPADPSSSKLPNGVHTPADGLLHAPSSTMHKHSRRNTTGSSTPLPPRPVRTSTVHGPGSHSYVTDDGEIEGELASDIQQQAEQIRRERQSKRVKAQQEAERVLTRTTSLMRAASARGDENPLVGNLIGEDHVNYVLMYNMLTGIRVAVSRCQAKIRRPLTAEDYTARHKFSFDIVGNELTPSAKYDFKFKDYAPWVFRELREDYFRLDPADYLLSLTAKYILSELGSPGKSGSFFYFSRDYRFIIKTIHHTEHKFLRSILKDYYNHVKNNPHTLISRFYGLHRVKLPRGRKIHFVIMNNLFPAHKDIHETYDLKGSTVGREYPEDVNAQKPRAVLKDLNWIKRGKTLEFGPEKRALLTEQLRRDSELLKQLSVMDYSLLIGIHNMQRGNRDNVRSNTLKVFSPDMPIIKRKPTQSKGASSPEAIALRRIMRESDPKALGVTTIKLPEEDTGGERQHFLFYQDEGGLRATDEGNLDMDTIYYLGVIDILTPYGTFKKLEHFWKGLSADRHKISPVPPKEYGERFFTFMKAIMRGGGGGARFKNE